MRDWNDLRLVLMVARSGSLRGAAQSLGIDHSTAYRRLQGIEVELGLNLFERAGGHYRATETGERVTLAAERIEAETLALERDITGRDTRLTGQLRLTASEALAYRVLPRLVAEFHRRHPGIRVELILDNRQRDLARREADVALRATRPSEPTLFGRKIAHVDWTIYGSDRYLRRAPRRPRLPTAPATTSSAGTIAPTRRRRAGSRRPLPKRRSSSAPRASSISRAPR